MATNPLARSVTFLNTEYKTQEEFGKFVKKIIYEDIGICYDIKNTYPEEYSILIKILAKLATINFLPVFL